MPVVRATTENTPPGQPDAAGAADGHAGRPLLAEDNPVNQRLFRTILTRPGYTVDIAADGRLALQLAAENRYSAILMDCQMPNMDGYQATEALRIREGPERHTPVIALTASAMATDRERCLEAGMDDYLTKPLHAADLAAALTRWRREPSGTSNLA